MAIPEIALIESPAFAERKIDLRATFTSLALALELSDPYTRGHSERVGSLSVALGIDLGLSNRELDILKDAGALHDIGKIGVDKAILNKPGQLTDEEFDKVKLHTVYGRNILQPLGLRELEEIAYLHHERPDGTGYPTGAREYPLLVRVVQIIDVWDALTSHRPYRDAMPSAKARKLMDGGASNLSFDPAILESFLRLTRIIFPDDDCDPHEMREVWREIESLKLSEGLLTGLTEQHGEPLTVLK